MKKKVPVKISKKPYENAREKNILPVKILWNSTRETEILTREKIGTFAPWNEKKKSNSHPWNRILNPWKKAKKVPVKKKVRVKKLQKVGVKRFFSIFLPVKITPKSAKNGFDGHFWVSRGKKKHCQSDLTAKRSFDYL